jgi:hypothetical protein
VNRPGGQRDREITFIGDIYPYKVFALLSKGPEPPTAQMSWFRMREIDNLTYISTIDLDIYSI